jgi:hypothetical protein
MKKISTHKLQLNKATIRALVDDALPSVSGGLPLTYTRNVDCASLWNTMCGCK